MTRRKKLVKERIRQEMGICTVQCFALKNRVKSGGGDERRLIEVDSYLSSRN